MTTPPPIDATRERLAQYRRTWSALLTTYRGDTEQAAFVLFSTGDAVAADRERLRAEVVLVDDALVDAYHLIAFLRDCLTPGTNAHHAHPEQTERALARLADMVEIPERCFHGVTDPQCPACRASAARRTRVLRAGEQLGIAVGPGATPHLTRAHRNIPPIGPA